MSSAQRLYEAGHITYMRTDSVNLSDEALTSAKDMVSKNYGSEYHKKRIFKTKTKSAQEAHEAIRPTNLENKDAGKNDTEKKLYNLIWRRTLASQMSDAILERTVVKIDTDIDSKFRATGEVLTFDGFLKLYDELTDKSKLLPKLLEKSSIETIKILSKEVFTKHPPRFSEASLIKKMEDSGIGRPSTFAETIRKIKEREYVVKEEREGRIVESKELTLENKNVSSEVVKERTGFEKNKIYPTNMGMFVTEFLNENFINSFMDYSFTAKTENQLDQIAFNGKNWNDMLKEFYKGFSDLSNKVPEERFQLERELGKYKGKVMKARIAKFGPVIQIGEKEDIDAGFPRYCNIPYDKLINHISIDEAISIINKKDEDDKLVSVQHKDGVIELKNGRYGFYIRYNEKNYKINKEKYPEPKSLSKEQLIEIINSPIEKSKDILAEFFSGSIQIRTGKYGKPPYILAVRGTEYGKIFQQKKEKTICRIS